MAESVSLGRISRQSDSAGVESEAGVGETGAGVESEALNRQAREARRSIRKRGKARFIVFMHPFKKIILSGLSLALLQDSL
jgi:hypothetical protein